MRARVFWIALPIAVGFALWAGPGLGTDDEMPELEPVQLPPDPTPALPDPAPELECEAPHDPGPDGDR